MAAPPPLTPAQLANLQGILNNVGLTPDARVDTYYQTLASYGYPYGSLALAVATNSSLAGQVANNFLAQAAVANGISYNSTIASQISYGLAKADLQARISADGADLSGLDVENYHQSVFNQYGLPISAWTGYVPYQILGETGWQTELNGTTGNESLVTAEVAAVAGVGLSGFPSVSQTLQAINWLANVAQAAYATPAFSSALTTIFPPIILDTPNVSAAAAQNAVMNLGNSDLAVMNFSDASASTVVVPPFVANLSYQSISYVNNLGASDPNVNALLQEEQFLGAIGPSSVQSGILAIRLNLNWASGNLFIPTDGGQVAVSVDGVNQPILSPLESLQSNAQNALLFNITNGTSQITTYNPPGSPITSTTTDYAGPNGTGAITEIDQENANGTSQITTYNPDGSSTSTTYSGPNGTGNITNVNNQNPGGTPILTINPGPGSSTYIVKSGTNYDIYGSGIAQVSVQWPEGSGITEVSFDYTVDSILFGHEAQIDAYYGTSTSPFESVIFHGIDDEAQVEADYPNTANIPFSLPTGPGLVYWAYVPGDTPEGEALAANANLVAFCYLTGTHILTELGECTVENLRVGDVVYARFAGTLLIKWIGHRHVDCRRHPHPHEVWPVRVRAGAFGDEQPRRDLWLSPDHAVYVEDVLIPIKHLINGTTVEQVSMDKVTYYHVELERHDLLLAEGLLAESYLDTGDRSNFTNGGTPIRMHPDFSLHQAWEVKWEAAGCAPLCTGGEVLERVAARLKERTATLDGSGPTRAVRPRTSKRHAAKAIDLIRFLRSDWYLDANRDVAEAGIDPVAHYRGWGRREGRRPNLYFETNWYRDAYSVTPDMNPLLHYVLLGENQNFRPSVHFDPAWYRRRYQLKPSISALAHYLKYRRTQRFSPLPTFDLDSYVQEHMATLLPGRDPYAHYLAIGQPIDIRISGDGRAAA